MPDVPEAPEVYDAPDFDFNIGIDEIKPLPEVPAANDFDLNMDIGFDQYGKPSINTDFQVEAPEKDFYNELKEGPAKPTFDGWFDEPIAPNVEKFNG